MKNLFLIIVVVTLFVSCKQDNKSEGLINKQGSKSVEQWNGYRKIEPTDIKDNVIKLIGKEWMLITSGNEDSFNTMTASWGGLGEIWFKPVSMITVRDTRYTYEFLQKNDYYTLSFFPDRLKNKLSLLGSKSGRDADKVKEAGLTPIDTPKGSKAFSEARMIIECRKLYSEPFNKESILDKDIVNKVYGSETSMHTLYIGEIVNVWVRE